MAKIVTMGEIMLRLSPEGNYRFIQTDKFNIIPGGGEANVAISCANYGHECYFVSKLPKHEIGQIAVNAIRKYGVGPEIWELQIIDNAESQEELNQKEQYWIRYYNSVEEGYNETDAISKCGGNTYQSKTEKEMEVIKEKIRQTKIGSKNPMAKKIKRTNIQTNEVDIFDTIIGCAKACGIQNGKTSITTRLKKKKKSPYKNTWLFEYYDE